MTQKAPLARLLALGGIAWFILWACAPMMTAPPATPMTGASPREVGFSAHGGGGLDLSSGERMIDERSGPAVLAGSTFWIRKAVGGDKRNQAGGFLHAMMLQETTCRRRYCGDGAWGIGGFYRKALSKADSFHSGLQISAGYPFVTLGVPLAWAVRDGWWLTTQPRLGVGFTSMVHLPVGLSVPIGRGGRIDAEFGVHIDAQALGQVGAPLARIRHEIYDGFDHYQYMPYIGLGYSLPLGARK